MAELVLRDGEQVLAETKGDYWWKLFLFLYSQESGRITLTDQRILFQGTVLSSLMHSLDLTYRDIASVRKCWIGPIVPFLPTGIKIRMKNGKSYELSVLKRQKYIDIIQSRI